ncbi:MAG: hypothetical protein M1818_007378 [Claussenomyces sp. TS43310]|nr:MAG: hypothetical protein M1818_007378 [Claussenomyces sp. TS43310]
MSSVYPDRPIRPLPKRRLRERLSPDVAESIKYPPAPPTTTPLFYYPYSLNGEEDRPRGEQYQIDRQRADEIERNYISRRSGDDVDSEEEYSEVAQRGRYSRHSPDQCGRSYRYVQKPETSKFAKPEPPASTASSADGYESFENTNNKKKRKIPTPGDAGLNGIRLSDDLALLGISQNAEDLLPRDEAGSSPSSLYAAGVNGNGQGISGPGRGRYGRVRDGRSPLRTLSDASNYSNGRTMKQRLPPWPPNETTGIISTAIANAEKLPVTPSRGQENVSLLQQVPKKPSPNSAQFTFTCDSQVPGTVAWPGPDSSKINMHQSSAARGMATQSTQTSPRTQAIIQPRQGLPATQHGPKANGKPAAPAKKSRRRPGKEYLIAARQRREQQEYQNYHHPPPPEDEWICEFCEYERIFGTPPEALIRQYEIKDRRVRKQEAERRRLLEKAKLKGRKGKKGTKNSSKNAVTNQERQAQHQQTQQPAARDHSQSQSQGTQSEDYYEDEYDDEYVQEDLPPSPIGVSHAKRQDGTPMDPKARGTLHNGTHLNQQHLVG